MVPQGADGGIRLVPKVHHVHEIHVVAVLAQPASQGPHVAKGAPASQRRVGQTDRTCLAEDHLAGPIGRPTGRHDRRFGNLSPQPVHKIGGELFGLAGQRPVARRDENQPQGAHE